MITLVKDAGRFGSNWRDHGGKRYLLVEFFWRIDPSPTEHA
jgi:hypothetical protein